MKGQGVKKVLTTPKAGRVSVDGAWTGTWTERAACGLISLFCFFLFGLASMEKKFFQSFTENNEDRMV